MDTEILYFRMKIFGSRIFWEGSSPPKNNPGFLPVAPKILWQFADTIPRYQYYIKQSDISSRRNPYMGLDKRARGWHVWKRSLKAGLRPNVDFWGEGMINL